SHQHISDCEPEDSARTHTIRRRQNHPKTHEPSSQDVRIVKAGVEDHQTWGPKAYVVHYEVKNSGSEEANYFVGLDFLDGAGRILGSTGVTADKVGKGSTAKGNTAPLPC
ncbi:hypothetical protein ACFU7B_39795, partial [Streptomyces sp. NPDC057545]